MAKRLSEKLKNQQDRDNPLVLGEVKRLQVELNQLLYQENLWWKQRAKWHKYREGDRNTKFFHACANQRRKKNLIQKIVTIAKESLEDKEQIAEEFNNYFSGLFRISLLSEEGIALSTGHIALKVIDEMNERLTKHYLKEEVLRY